VHTIGLARSRGVHHPHGTVTCPAVRRWPASREESAPVAELSRRGLRWRLHGSTCESRDYYYERDEKRGRTTKDSDELRRFSISLNIGVAPVDCGECGGSCLLLLFRPRTRTLNQNSKNFGRGLTPRVWCSKYIKFKRFAQCSSMRCRKRLPGRQESDGVVCVNAKSQVLAGHGIVAINYRKSNAVARVVGATRRSAPRHSGNGVGKSR